MVLCWILRFAQNDRLWLTVLLLTIIVVYNSRFQFALVAYFLKMLPAMAVTSPRGTSRLELTISLFMAPETMTVSPRS